MSLPHQLLLICNEPIKPNMTGPAIRYWEIATVLANHFTVTLAVPPFVQKSSAPQELTPSFKVHLCQSVAELKALASTTDVIITVGANLSIYPFLTNLNKPLVVDMYIPFMLEDLQKHRDKPLQQQRGFYDGSRGSHTLQIRAADFILCANDKQKDFWLGWLGALGRINPYTHRDDPSLSKLIAVVPFGLPRQIPIHDQQVLKGVYKTIAQDDKVILWGGGLWNWLDPQSLIKAMSRLAKQYPTAKLFFMGTKSPNPSTAKMSAASQALRLSQALGLLDTHIFFNDWVPYQERHNYLLEADIGVSLHLNHVETHFSFRTRLLDYIWAGLPMVVTEGDVLSEAVARYDLGEVVSSGNVDHLSRVLLDLLETSDLRQRYKPNFDRIRTTYEWETVVQPLIKFCEAPYVAADKPHLNHIPLVESGVSSWWTLPQKILRTARRYGLAELFRRTQEFIRWKLQR